MDAYLSHRPPLSAAAASALSAVPLLLATLLPSPLFAQRPDVHDSTRLVVVPAIVTDSVNGQPVTALAPQDFEILEDGRPQPVDLFHFYSASTASFLDPFEPQSGASPAGPRYFGPPAAPVGSLVLDLYNAGPADLRLARDAIAAVLKDQNLPGRWALTIFGHSGAWYTKVVSGEVDTLLRELEPTPEAGRASRSGKTPPELRAQRDQVRTLFTLTTLRGIARHLAGFPGRKSIFWITAGPPLRNSGKVDPALWQETLDVLNDANVGVFLITRDTPPIPVPPLTNNRAQPFPKSARPPAQSNANPLQAIAAATAGRSFTGLPQFAAAARTAFREARSFYWLAYHPTHGRWDGRTIPLQVNIQRAGLEVRARSSYLARPLGPLSNSAADRVLNEVMRSSSDAAQLGFFAALHLAPASEGLVLEVLIDPGSLGLLERDGFFIGMFEVRYAQVDHLNRHLEDFTENVPVRLDLKTAARVRAERIRYRRMLHPLSGVRLVRVVLLDATSAHVASTSLAVPQ